MGLTILVNMVLFISISLLFGVIGFMVSWGYQVVIPHLFPKLLFKFKAMAEIYEDAIDQGFIPNYNWRDTVLAGLANILGYNKMVNTFTISLIVACSLHLVMFGFYWDTILSVVISVAFSCVINHIVNE